MGCRQMHMQTRSSSSDDTGSSVTDGLYGSALRSHNLSSSSKSTVFSGIQPTGIPHLGNLLGAILPWVSLQNRSHPSSSLLFSIVDLHSLTSSVPAAVRLSNRRNLLAALLAAGLDPSRCTIFYQSAVPQHAELHWILSCTSSVSELARMTQWKTKLAERNPDREDHAVDPSYSHSDRNADLALLTQAPNPRNIQRLKLGLFSYPVLQAADILVHRATHVPVGEDQRQHVEFARTCAGVFNHHYSRSASSQARDTEHSGTSSSAEASLESGEILLSPEVLVSPAKRIMSLMHPQKKMSKSSRSPKSLILLTDSDDDIRKRIRAALTDSLPGVTYDRSARPGVSNLLEMIAHAEGLTLENLLQEAQGLNFAGLKDRAASAVIGLIAPIRERFEGLVGEGHGKRLDEIAGEGADRARINAEATMRGVRDAVGI